METLRNEDVPTPDVPAPEEGGDAPEETPEA